MSDDANSGNVTGTIDGYGNIIWTYTVGSGGAGSGTYSNTGTGNTIVAGNTATNGGTYAPAINGNTGQMTINWFPLNVPVTDPGQQCTAPEEKKKESGKCVCKKCGEFYPYAEENAQNTINGKFTCWGCRNY